MILPDFRRVDRKNPELYREHGAKTFAGGAVKYDHKKRFHPKTPHPCWVEPRCVKLFNGQTWHSSVIPVNKPVPQHNARRV